MLIEGVRMADASNVTQSQHSCKGGGTPPSHDICSVSDRLYSQVHVCNHARCASNDPDYNVKSAVPARKFLVAKKHAYGGLEEKGENKRASSGSSTTAPDHQRHQSHALKSLTYSVLTTESGSICKVRSNELRSNANSVGQSKRATRDNSSISSNAKMVVRRKLRPTTTQSSSVPFGSSTKRSCVTTPESHSTAQKSRLSSVGSISSPPATEHSKQWEELASPDNSLTSIRITQIISTRREEKEDEAAAAAATSSPTTSVGSNHDTEFSSLKETVIVVQQVGIFEQPIANFGDLQSPASSSSNVLHKNSGNKEASFDSPSPSSSYRQPGSKSLTPSTPSTGVASTAPRLRNSAVAQEETNCRLSIPSVDSRPTTSGSLTSSVTSLKSGPRLTNRTSTVRSSRTTTPPSSSDKLVSKLTTNLKESPQVGSPMSSSSRAAANRPSGIPRNSVSAAPVDSSPAPTNASRLAERFITDLQARSVARRGTKGVRSIELRGGKPQSYSTTTVTSWNMTTTTVETSVSISEITNVESGLAGTGLVEVSVKPKQFSKKTFLTAAAGATASAANLKAINEAPTILKFAKSARSSEEVHVKHETVALKHGEVAERRLSEEYMTNHALEGVVRKISENDHRVKVLVDAFETLAKFTDSEALAIEEKTLNQHLGLESLTATLLSV